MGNVPGCDEKGSAPCAPAGQEDADFALEAASWAKLEAVAVEPGDKLVRVSHSEAVAVDLGDKPIRVSQGLESNGSLGATSDVSPELSQVTPNHSSVLSVRNVMNEPSQGWRRNSSLASRRNSSLPSRHNSSFSEGRHFDDSMLGGVDSMLGSVDNELSQAHSMDDVTGFLNEPSVMHLESNIPELSEVVAVFSQGVRRLNSRASNGTNHALGAISWEKSRDSMVTMSKTERHKSQRYSQVDEEIVRGITLRKSLWRLGRLWRHNPAKLPPEERAALFNLSRVATSFNVFISHTWRTPGRWKVLSLFFQCGWPNAMLSWLVACVVSATLCMQDVLPMPLVYKADVLGFVADCPLGFWILISSLLATCAGFFTAPYRPHWCGKPDVCFIDVASIHQLDHKLMERGVYGIAGFLSVADELRVLWSLPYLTRLWCVFELAAYRKVNPGGTIAFRPLFIERVLFQLLLATYAYQTILLASRTVDSITSLAHVRYLFFVLPWAFCVYGLRMNFREKLNLFAQLEAFDVEQAHCTEEFDRIFIHAAITKWYGSKAAFSDYVRNDLRRHLEEVLRSRLPAAYVLIAVTPLLSTGAEFFISMWRGGAPPECLLSFFLGSILGFYLLWAAACLLLLVYLCDRFASPRWGRLDHLQTLAIFLVTLSILGVGAAASSFIYTVSLIGSALFVLGALIFFIFVLWLEGSFVSNFVRFCRRRREAPPQTMQESP